MRDKCKVCRVRCDYMTDGLSAEFICPCCRHLIAGLHPEQMFWSTTAQSSIATFSYEPAER
jgi:hypothetical protein